METTVIELARDVTLMCLTSDKFKTGCLSATLLTQLGWEFASQNALIPSVLRRGTRSYPDMERLNARLDELYGASIEPLVRKKGEIQCLGFFASFADDAFVPEGGVLDSTAELLCEMLLSPNLRGGLFLPEYVQSEKEKQLELLRARVNDKLHYAGERLFELMCFAEDYAVYPFGDEESTAAITYQKLTRRYHALLSESPLLFFYCGSARPERLAEILRKALLTLPRAEPNLELGTEVRLNAYESAPRVFTEEMDVTQGKLNIGFRLGDV
ncbi:MAG: insulinase family protein, partial [Firmicutes bacterium]|nr:insulinase family protein [Bacillota bacterium]